MHAGKFFQGFLSFDDFFKINFSKKAFSNAIRVSKSLDSDPGGGNLNFSYIHRLASFFWVQNFEYQYFMGFSENIFLGYEDLVDIFWGSLQNWTIFRGCISMHFRVFSKGHC